MQPEGEIWGHLNPLLQEVSNVTGVTAEAAGTLNLFKYMG